MTYSSIGTFITTQTGFKTVSGNKLRLFRFSRLPNLGVGVFVVDPTGLGLVGEQAVTYVGAEGIGYVYDFAPGSEGVFTTEAVAVVFKKGAPDAGGLASESDTMDHITRVARVVGATINPGKANPAPEYRTTPNYFDQGDPLVPVVEKLDGALKSLSDHVDEEIVPPVAGIYRHVIKRIDVNARGLVTKVVATTPGSLTITSTTYLNKVIETDITLSSSWSSEIDLLLPSGENSDTKAAIFFLSPIAGTLTMPNANRKHLIVKATPDTTDALKTQSVLWMQGGEDADGGIDRFGMGAQFSMPVGKSGGQAVIYLKVPTFESSGVTDMIAAAELAEIRWELSLVAYQQ